MLYEAVVYTPLTKRVKGEVQVLRDEGSREGSFLGESQGSRRPEGRKPMCRLKCTLYSPNLVLRDSLLIRL